jgi:hypothetical protein
MRAFVSFFQKRKLSMSTQLPKEKLDTRKEVVIPITLKGLVTGIEKIFHKAPLKAFQYIMRKADTFSNRLMTGAAAALTMPAGIIVRNGARAAHHSSRGAYAHVSNIVGLVGAAGSWYIAGSAVASKLSTLAVAGTLGKIGTTIAAAVVAAPVVIPAFTAGILLSATAIGAVTAALSVVPAVVNLPVAIRRSVDRFKGLRYKEADLQQQLHEESLEAEHQRKAFRVVSDNLRYLSEDDQQRVFKTLKDKFDAAATPAAQASDTVANENAPARRRGVGVKVG